MKVLVVADGHYFIDRQNNVFVESVFDYTFYERYLLVFEEVFAIIRAEYVDSAPLGCKKASGPNVHFLPILPSKGFYQFVKSYIKNRILIKKYIHDFDCAIFRVPGVVANTVMSLYSKTGKKYAIEVVVDPWEYFSKGTIKSFTRPFVQRLWTRSLKKACMSANGVSYVTQQYLQHKYPCKAIINPNSTYFTGSYSSVELPDDAFGQPRKFSKKNKYIISHVANAFTSYGKGHLTLMNAAKIILKQGYNIEIWFIGDGPLKDSFIRKSKELGIQNNVFFLGRMSSGMEVRSTIKKTDLFVFPTKAEGLPRVVLEAMAEGIPVIASPVCGIPEILPQECLVEQDDYEKYADVIIKMINNPVLRSELSCRNLNIAKEYRKSILNDNRKKFYSKLKQLVQNED